MLTGHNSDFVILGFGSENPSFFWKGVLLSGVVDVFVHPWTRKVTLRVSNYEEMQEVYSQMEEYGLRIRNS